MSKRTSVKRISTASPSASNSIDVKARKRIEQLFEITDEIINAYNEINDKYVHQIYRKYKQLQDINKNLKEKLHNHHCAGCKCTIETNGHHEEQSSDEEVDNNQQPSTPAIPTPTISSIITRSKKKNPFIISDTEETQNFDTNDSRFNQNSTDDENSMDTDQNTRQIKTANESSDESEDDEADGDEEEEDAQADGDDGMARLPRALQNVIYNKVKRKKSKAYLLQVHRYPALCEYLRDRSRSSFDHRPSEVQVRPLIENHISKIAVQDAKVRMRLRDELREIHRSYLRTFMYDPHSIGWKSTNDKDKLPTKKSPM